MSVFYGLSFVRFGLMIIRVTTSTDIMSVCVIFRCQSFIKQDLYGFLSQADSLLYCMYLDALGKGSLCHLCGCEAFLP